MALLYAAASPDAELLAVTCVGGNVDARQVERNTRAVLELAGRTDLEVALGDERPLVRRVETTPETHGPQGLGYAELPPATRPLRDRHAGDGEDPLRRRLAGSADRARARRHREGEDPAGPRRRARPAGRQHPGRLDC